MTLPAPTTSGPYAAAATTYRGMGWVGVLPIPAGRKQLRKEGWTGHTGAWPSGADIQAWTDNPAPDEGGGNIALRMPPDVIGIDVDAYHPTGLETIREARERWGVLPPTWVSTARGRSPSGIAFYRVPEGLRWPGQVGPHVELIQTAHRYAVVWPSIHPDLATVYRWYSPDGLVTTVPPRPEDFPDLTPAWVSGLTGGQLAEDVAFATLAEGESADWLIGHGSGQPCGAMATVRDRLLGELASGSAHESLRRLMGLVRLAEKGHPGLLTAIGEVNVAFVAESTRASRTGTPRTLDEAQGEWRRSLDGAVRRVLGRPSVAESDAAPPPGDPCLNPFQGLIAPLSIASLAPTLSVPVEPAEAVTVQSGASTAASGPAPEQPPADVQPDDEPSLLEQVRERLILAELSNLEIRGEAKRRYQEEQALAAFREPVWRASLTDELAIPDEPVTYTVAELMPTGANVLLTAQFKAGKTTLVNSLTRALADGEPFLGRFEVSAAAGRIALWNYEVDERQYRRWLRELDISNTDAVTPLNLRGYRLPLISRWVEDWVVDWLTTHKIGVWIVDPFARAFVGSGTSENDNTEVGRFLDTLDVIKSRAGVSDLIMPTHTGRAEMDEGQERARGATRLDDWADVRWLLTKDKDDRRYFRASGRDVNVEESALFYEPSTRFLSLGVGSVSRKQALRVSVQKSILDVLQARPGIGKRDLLNSVRADMGQCSKEVFDQAFEPLVGQGRLRVVLGAGNKPSQHFVADFDDLLGES